LINLTGAMSMDQKLSKTWTSPPLMLSALVLVLWFSWRAILGFILHMLLIFAEILELGLDHLLENVLHLEGHSAQMYTAWIGLGTFMALVAYCYVHARQYFFTHFQTWDKLAFVLNGWAKAHWLTLALPLAVLIVTASLF
jgi:hypothetical protein